MDLKNVVKKRKKEEINVPEISWHILKLTCLKSFQTKGWNGAHFSRCINFHYSRQRLKRCLCVWQMVLGKDKMVPVCLTNGSIHRSKRCMCSYMLIISGDRSLYVEHYLAWVEHWKFKLWKLQLPDVLVEGFYLKKTSSAFMRPCQV